MEKWLLPALSRQTLTAGPFGEGSCIMDVDGGGLLKSSAATMDPPLAWFAIRAAQHRRRALAIGAGEVTYLRK